MEHHTSGTVNVNGGSFTISSEFPGVTAGTFTFGSPFGGNSGTLARAWDANGDIELPELHAQISVGDLRCIKIALGKSSLDINQKDHLGNTALHEAVRSNRREIVDLLLQHPSININSQDRMGQTALQLAIDRYNMGIGILGIRSGIFEMLFLKTDLKLHDLHGMTALDHAIDADSFEMVDMLVAAIKYNGLDGYKIPLQHAINHFNDRKTVEALKILIILSAPWCTNMSPIDTDKKFKETHDHMLRNCVKNNLTGVIELALRYDNQRFIVYILDFLIDNAKDFSESDFRCLVAHDRSINRKILEHALAPLLINFITFKPIPTKESTKPAFARLPRDIVLYIMNFLNPAGRERFINQFIAQMPNINILALIKDPHINGYLRVLANGKMFTAQNALTFKFNRSSRKDGSKVISDSKSAGAGNNKCNIG